MINHTIAVTELIWALAGIPGMVAWTLNLLSVYRAYRVALKQGGPSGKLIGGSLFRLGMFGLSAALSLVFLGLFGMTQPQPIERITPLGWAVTGVLVWFGLITTAAGLDINRTIYKVFSITRGAPDDADTRIQPFQDRDHRP